MASFDLIDKYLHQNDQLMIWGRFTSDNGLKGKMEATTFLLMADRADIPKRNAAMNLLLDDLKDQMKVIQDNETGKTQDIPENIYNAMVLDIDTWIAGDME